MSQIPAKISSDAGEASPMTQVFVQNMYLEDLVKRLLSYTSKDQELVCQVIRCAGMASQCLRIPNTRSTASITMSRNWRGTTL